MMKNKQKNKVLFYAPILEYPPAGGPQISVVNAIKVLSDISDLHIITPTNSSADNRLKNSQFFNQYCKNIVYCPSSKLHSENIYINSILRKVRRLSSPLIAIFDGAFIIKYSIENRINILWIDRVIEHSFSIFKYLRNSKFQKHLIADTEAVHSLFILRELPFVKNPFRRALIWVRGKKSELEEKYILKYADVVTAVSEIDANHFRNIAEKKDKVFRFSNVIDINEYKEIPNKIRNLNEPCALLLGSFGHINSPMDRAARWLTASVLPAVLAEIPNFKLYIIGRNSDKTLQDLKSDNIFVVGKVQKIHNFLAKATMTLVPLKFESGTRFKILESGAAKIPCISTTLGAEGINITHEKDIILADSATDFSQAMINVATAPKLQQSIGKNLHKLIASHYSLEVQKEEGKKILVFLENTHEQNQ